MSWTWLMRLIKSSIIGAIIGMGVAMALAHIALIWLARAHGVWDAGHDLVFALLGLATGAAAVWMHWDVIQAMIASTA